MKPTLLKKTLFIILITVVLSAALTALVFRYTGIRAYGELKIGELVPRAAFIATRTAEYFQGFIGAKEYQENISSNRRVWDAAPYVYNGKGELVAYAPTEEFQSNQKLIGLYSAKVLAGENIGVVVTKGTGAGVLVGAPVVSLYGNVIGAVFLVKTVDELNAAWGSLTTALVIAMLLVMVLMILPAYLVSRGLTGPLKQMNAAALAMAKGDFTVRAMERGKDEVAQLGRSLNDLSGALSGTIGALTFERNRLRGVLDGLGEGVIAVNARGEATQYNPASLQLLGAQGEIEANALYQGILPTVKAVLSDGAARVEERSRGEAALRFTISPLHGVDPLGGNAPQNGESGPVEGALILVQDVTEAIRLEQTRRDYVANVSHELRTPLAAIRGLSDALCDGMVKKEEDKLRYYGYIQKESIRLSRLIDDLLELSRLQSGAVAIEKRRMSVNELVMDVAERYESVAAERGSALALSLPDEELFAWSNPDRAEQVLIALVDNAVKHSAEGDVELSVTPGAEHITVCVTNPGSIREEDVGHIFERFYKADRAHSGEGTGLGLSISKEVMNLLGERIWAESRDGRVSFRFTLKRHNPAA